jgi:hypothetical protein
VEWFNNKEWKGQSTFVLMPCVRGSGLAVPCSSKAVVAAAALATAAAVGQEQERAVVSSSHHCDHLLDA